MTGVAVYAATPRHDTIPDTRRLGMALDYFAGGKYHEALALFVTLDRKYTLNPRFKAYIGLCHYYEWNYKKAAEYLDGAIPALAVYSPAERNIYYKAAAESHFYLEEYPAAINLYELQLLVCQPAERADALYRLGFCYMFDQRWSIAADYFRSSLAYYAAFPRPNVSSRISQLKNMIKGCEEKVKRQKGEKVER